MTENCLFCRIVRREIPATIVYEDEYVLAFRDVSPKAPTHVLVIPKEHIASVNDLSDPLVGGRLLIVAQYIATEEGIAENGYRTVINCGVDGGQSVFHVHLHLLGGRAMAWPPG